nr:ATPase assembly factor ATP10, mitochondria [Tanacetum cinerariifolium]
MYLQIATANKVIIPAMAAVKFPQLEVSYSNGKSFKLPITSYGTDTESMKADIPKATLTCLSFRAASHISFIESWLLSMTPIKRLLLRMLKKSKPHENGVLQRQIGYAFGDHYYFRIELKN